MLAVEMLSKVLAVFVFLNIYIYFWNAYLYVYKLLYQTLKKLFVISQVLTKTTSELGARNVDIVSKALIHEFNPEIMFVCAAVSQNTKVKVSKL